MVLADNMIYSDSVDLMNINGLMRFVGVLRFHRFMFKLVIYNASLGNKFFKSIHH